MIGYKAFKPNLKCRDFQYEIGETYTLKEEPIMCKRGFHFCNKIADCFNFYPFDGKTRIAEVESLGKVIPGCEKNVTNKIRIIREISLEEQFELLNLDKELCKIFIKLSNFIQAYMPLLGGIWSDGTVAGSFNWYLHYDLTGYRVVGGRAVIKKDKIIFILFDNNENITLYFTSNPNINREILIDTLIKIEDIHLFRLVENLIEIF